LEDRQLSVFLFKKINGISLPLCIWFKSPTQTLIFSALLRHILGFVKYWVISFNDGGILKRHSLSFINPFFSVESLWGPSVMKLFEQIKSKWTVSYNRELSFYSFMVLIIVFNPPWFWLLKETLVWGLPSPIRVLVR
jgi:hypothetical protein